LQDSVIRSRPEHQRHLYPEPPRGSRSPCCSAPGAWQSGTPDVIFFAPHRSVCRTADQRSEARQQVFPDWSRLLETAFYSPSTAARCRATIQSSKLLACFFAAPLIFPLNPFGLLLLRLRPGLPQPRRIQRNRPVAQLLVQRFRLVLGSPLPFGVLSPLRIEAFNPTALRKAHLLRTARFPFAPRQPSILLVG
jgi:hypothetical protein